MASEGFLRFRDRLLEAGPFGTGEVLLPRGFDDMQETGQSFGRLKCYLGPHPHRRSDPVFRLLNVCGGPFEASHDAPEALREGREGKIEQGEENDFDLVGVRGYRLPNADPLGLKYPQPA